jgi:hypothetical protein
MDVLILITVDDGIFSEDPNLLQAFRSNSQGQAVVVSRELLSEVLAVPFVVET